MDNSKYYLYAAAVQGIQNFIFQSDELKDMVGASELVEKICTEYFEEFGNDEDNKVINAAGNIKYIFHSKAECERAVLEFPKKVMLNAPGITVSQAVCGYDSEGEFGGAIDKIEELLKAQRNKQSTSDPVFMSMRRSRQTGMPVTEHRKGVYYDEATVAKRRMRTVKKLSEICFGFEKGSLPENKISYNIEDITDKNDWIAIIHADGNGLGQIVQEVGKDRKQFREFSINLDLSTKNAAVSAYKLISKKYNLDSLTRIPIRPVILGGDDFTVIARADLAIEYTKAFLHEFEIETSKNLKNIFNEFNHLGNKLTACAGISFIKSSYPFYYGYDLAESLCSEAKREAKMKSNDGITAKSCLMFHKVQDSFVVDYKDIEQRELTTSKKKSFKYGPYYIYDNDGVSIDSLLENVVFLDSQNGNAIKSHLRNWLSDMLKNEDKAQQGLNRLLSNVSNSSESGKYVKSVTSGDRIFAYDILSLHSIMYSQTKKEE